MQITVLLIKLGQVLVGYDLNYELVIGLLMPMMRFERNRFEIKYLLRWPLFMTTVLHLAV